MWAINITLIFGFILVLFETQAVYPLEDALVLPKGVRRLMINTFHARFDSMSDQFGNSTSLAQPLQRDVTFNDFINVRTGVEKLQLQSFLAANNLNESDVVGNVSADLKGKMDVYAPSLGVGITDKLSLGFAVPIHRAVTDVTVGFNANKRADEFIALLADPEVGQTHRAHEAVDALNSVPNTLNNKLEDHGYERLGRWEKTGVGDILLKGKYQAVDTPIWRSAFNFGVSLPTGRTDSPDNLTDLPFGDGSTDFFGGFSFDEPIVASPFFFNQYFLYTMQLPAKRTIRMKTAEEQIEVEKKNVWYDLGDKLEGGTSLQWSALSGVIGGVGYTYQHKFKDQYRAGASSKEYEKNTTQSAHLLEGNLGYSSINAFRANRISIPFASSVGYLKQLQTRNTPLTDRWQLEAKVFF